MWRVRAMFLILISSGKLLSNSCPIELSPSSVVVRFGDPVSVNCTTSLDEFEGMGWEATEGGTSSKREIKMVTWSVASLKTWSIQPICYVTMSDYVQCQQNLEVTVYKMPDTVSIWPSLTGPMEAGGLYQLQCDIRNIAPVRNLSLTWYRGNEIIHTETRDNDIATPQNESFNLPITPEKDDDGIQIQCEVQMNLGISGPQWTPIKSEPFDMVVYYPPSFISPLPEILDLAVDDKPILNCTADGNPQPYYRLVSSAGYVEATETKAVFRLSSPLLPGTYNCTAANRMGSATKVFIVQNPPKNITQLEDTELEVGSSSTLKCFSEANPPPIFHWDYYKTGNVEVTYVAGGSLLHIKKATDVNIGNYTCIVAYALKNISHVARVTVKGANSQCPIEITPERLVMPYGGQTSVTCGNSTEDASRNMIGVFWRVGQRVVNGAQWDVEKDTDWDLRAECIATFSGIGECSKRFDVTFYKTADNVLIHSMGHTGPMVANTEYQLQCDILNVAPVQNLTVSWYQDNDLNDDQGSLRVTGCPHQNMDCASQEIKSPVNVSSTIKVSLERNQHRAQFRCEAQLALEQQRPPPMMSHNLSLSVYYEPIINSTKLPSSVPVLSGYPVELVCEADGRPAPNIHWFSKKGVRVSSGNLTVTEAGVWTCNATNVVGFNIHEVVVVFKEDYLPLIAGFVAATVLVISVVFAFFYSIYYKNTKMRHYSLKNPKLNTQNGNVAHNSWDSPLPMTKLC
ncbi:unnamed protein product [Lota lota]